MCGKISTRAGKRTFYLGLRRRLIDYAVLEGLLVVAMPRLFLLSPMNMTVQMAVVTVTNVAGLVTRLPWTSPLTASCQFLMCGGLLRTLTRDATLATATAARWMTSRRYLPAVMDIRPRIPLTHPALYTTSLHGMCHLPTHTPSHHLRAHIRRLHINLLLRLPPYRRSLQAS